MLLTHFGHVVLAIVIDMLVVGEDVLAVGVAVVNTWAIDERKTQTRIPD